MSKRRIEDIEACIDSITGALNAGIGAEKPDNITPHQQIGAHLHILRLKGEVEDLRESMLERDKSGQDADLKHQLDAKKVEVRALQSKLHDAETRLVDLEESLSIYRSES